MFYPIGIDPTSGTGSGVEPADEDELLTLKRGTKTDDGKGSKTTVWATIAEDLVGKVRFYQERGTRKRLESSPGVQTQTGRLVFFSGSLVGLEVKVNDRIVRADGETLSVLHIRRYVSSLQLDTEIVA
jgi:hypothetical protein